MDSGPSRPASLRERRLECGLTQGELAARAGVSRQLVAAVEAGRNTPAVDAALRIAGALATKVEVLFSAASEPVVAALGGPVPEAVPLRIGRVGDQLVAAELSDHGAAGAGWAKPDGRLERGALRLFEGAAPGGLVLAGCDPALGVAERMVEGLGERSLMAISAASAVALRALERGTVHAAVVHGPARALPRPVVRVRRLHLARWRVGLGAASRRRGVDVQSLVGSGMPLVTREAGAASQQAFERALAELEAPARPARVATGHLDAARAAALLGGVAVTTEAAAKAFGLQFIALEEHTVQLWIAERWLQHPGVDTLGELLAGRAFTDRVAQYGGYDLAGCGTVLAPAG